MGTTEIANVKLDCCGAELEVSFDEAEAPFLAPQRLRKNVSCPACTCLVILTLTRGPFGSREVGQELID